MTIVKLILTEDRNLKYNPEQISYHINTHVADEYAKRMIENGTMKPICNGRGIFVKFLRNYVMEYIDVNEGD